MEIGESFRYLLTLYLVNSELLLNLNPKETFLDPFCASRPSLA